MLNQFRDGFTKGKGFIIELEQIKKDYAKQEYIKNREGAGFRGERSGLPRESGADTAGKPRGEETATR